MFKSLTLKLGLALDPLPALVYGERYPLSHWPVGFELLVPLAWLGRALGFDRATTQRTRPVKTR